MTRLERIELLLKYLDSERIRFTPGAPIWGGYRASTPGPAPSTKSKCPTCKGIGRMGGSGPCKRCTDGHYGDHKCKQCAICKGRGSVFRDAYTGQVVEHQERTAKPVGGLSRRGKRTNDRCVADQVHELTVFLRAEGLGGFADLDRCMARLRREDEVAWSHVRARYARGWKPDTLADALALDRGLGRLVEWMPREVRVPAFVFALEASTGEASRLSGKSRAKVRRLKRAA